MFFNVKYTAVSLATGSRPNDWDCSKAEWGAEMGDAPRASTPRRRLNFVFPFFSSFFFLFFLRFFIFIHPKYILGNNNNNIYKL